jgi:hypothetical protein
MNKHKVIAGGGGDCRISPHVRWKLNGDKESDIWKASVHAQMPLKMQQGRASSLDRSAPLCAKSNRSELKQQQERTHPSVVIGAGLSGLSCAYTLSREGLPVLVLEKESRIGGFAASFPWHGLWCDRGPHRFHSRKLELIAHLKNLMGDNLAAISRKSQILLGNRYYEYPIQMLNILHLMPKRTMVRILFDYFVRRMRNLISTPPDDSFESWIVNRY